MLPAINTMKSFSKATTAKEKIIEFCERLNSSLNKGFRLEFLSEENRREGNTIIIARIRDPLIDLPDLFSEEVTLDHFEIVNYGNQNAIEEMLCEKLIENIKRFIPDGKAN